MIIHLDLDVIDPSQLWADRFKVPVGASIEWLEAALRVRAYSAGTLQPIAQPPKPLILAKRIEPGTHVDQHQIRIVLFVPLLEALANEFENHTHGYLTGHGGGHNNTAVITSKPNSTAVTTSKPK